jgi:SAM-dependent methyltransferase
MAGVSGDDARRYYEDFSLAVGVRDWIVTNPRHEQLKLLIDELLTGRSGLRVLDVGCGAGLMSDHLRRYGMVTGVDFSAAAIRAAQTFAARRLGSRAEFIAGSLEDVPIGKRFDLITLFDVLEHIRADRRPDFLTELRARLAADAMIFVSTPHPAFTRYRRDARDPTLQIIDEQLELPRILGEADTAGLQLIRYQAYDVFAGSPEYQAMVFAPTRSPGGPPALRTPGLERRMRHANGRIIRRARKVNRAGRLLLAGKRRAARKVLFGPTPDVRS